ncbi:hypothetical protein CKA32_001577 [Geitlerinema sp. FC II]|nr:hypothetical protein CKA32_001577 [Geitlerinema sp. FC II]
MRSPVLDGCTFRVSEVTTCDRYRSPIAIANLTLNSQF